MKKPVFICTDEDRLISINDYNFQICDGCGVELGLSEFTLYTYIDTVLIVCEDCLTITKKHGSE